MNKTPVWEIPSYNAGEIDCKIYDTSPTVITWYYKVSYYLYQTNCNEHLTIILNFFNNGRFQDCFIVHMQSAFMQLQSWYADFKGSTNIYLGAW